VTPLWTILIPTLAWRQDKFQRLLGILGPQLEPHGGQVTILALRNNAERPLGRLRQDLMEAATSQYISFADDDDTVPDDFVARVVPLLDGVDYIGFRMQAYHDGVPLKPTFHSLRYDSWWDDARGYYRDVTPRNPVRRDLTIGTDFTGSWPEDRHWAAQMRGRLKTEHYIGECMQHYWHDTSDTVQDPGFGPRPVPRLQSADWCPYFSWHPASTL
jgi:hypothetical protein